MASYADTYEQLVAFIEARCSVRTTGHTGNGYSWEAVARHAVESALPELEEKIEFDSEADMFCAVSADREALAKLGGVLADAARSRKRLATLIASVPPSLWDD